MTFIKIATLISLLVLVQIPSYASVLPYTRLCKLCEQAVYPPLPPDHNLSKHTPIEPYQRKQRLYALGAIGPLSKGNPNTHRLYSAMFRSKPRSNEYACIAWVLAYSGVDTTANLQRYISNNDANIGLMITVIQREPSVSATYLVLSADHSFSNFHMRAMEYPDCNAFSRYCSKYPRICLLAASKNRFVLEDFEEILDCSYSEGNDLPAAMKAILQYSNSRNHALRIVVRACKSYFRKELGPNWQSYCTAPR